VSTLLLIRHGQASIHAACYDVLSDLGVEQARQLGRTLADWQLSFDAVYTGPSRRHVDTAAHMRETAGKLECLLPEPQKLEGLDEIDVTAVSAEATRRVLPSCPNLVEQLASGQLDAEGRKAVGHMRGIMGKLLERWAAGEDVMPGVESYDGFSSRVQSALSQIMRLEGRGRRVAVVTSGGPITVAIRMALGIDPQRAAALMPVLANASLTQLMYTEDRLSLVGFNAIGHLLKDKLLSRI